MFRSMETEQVLLSFTRLNSSFCLVTLTVAHFCSFKKMVYYFNLIVNWHALKRDWPRLGALQIETKDRILTGYNAKCRKRKCGQKSAVLMFKVNQRKNMLNTENDIEEPRGVPYKNTWMIRVVSHIQFVWINHLMKKHCLKRLTLWKKLQI